MKGEWHYQKKEIVSPLSIIKRALSLNLKIFLFLSSRLLKLLPQFVKRLLLGSRTLLSSLG